MTKTRIVRLNDERRRTCNLSYHFGNSASRHDPVGGSTRLMGVSTPIKPTLPLFNDYQLVVPIRLIIYFACETADQVLGDASRQGEENRPVWPGLSLSCSGQLGTQARMGSWCFFEAPNQKGLSSRHDGSLSSVKAHTSAIVILTTQ